MPGACDLEHFSLVRGGPLYGLLRASRLIRAGRGDVIRQSLALWAVAWLPIVLFDLARLGLAGTGRELIADLSLHVRLLVATPLLFVADNLLDRLCRRAVAVFAAGRFATADQRDRLCEIVRGAERRRDSRVVEGAMALVVLLASLGPWVVSGKAGLVVERTGDGGPAPAAWWIVLVSLPICNFLLLRSLYRWLIWARLLWGLSRLELRLMPTHPDLAGGLRQLSEPVLGFAIVLASMSTTIAAAWGERLLVSGEHFSTHTGDFAAIAVLGEVLAFLPLTALSPQLVRARLRGLVDYGRLSLEYTRGFHERWVTRAEPADSDPPELLGTPDIQSLADLASGYDLVEKMRPVPFNPRQVVLVLGFMVIPMLPLAATEVPFDQLLAGLGRTFLGGLPH